VTDAVLDDVREWQNRPLDAVYPAKKAREPETLRSIETLSLSARARSEELKLRLPIEEWYVQFYQDFVAVAPHQNGGGLYWTKYLGDTNFLTK
jgi:hypothetical protein